MVNLVSGILLVSNVILTVVALIRRWRWKAVLPIFFGVSFTLVVAKSTAGRPLVLQF